MDIRQIKYYEFGESDHIQIYLTEFNSEFFRIDTEFGKTPLFTRRDGTVTVVSKPNAYPVPLLITIKDQAIMTVRRTSKMVNSFTLMCLANNWTISGAEVREANVLSQEIGTVHILNNITSAQFDCEISDVVDNHVNVELTALGAMPDGKYALCGFGISGENYWCNREIDITSNKFTLPFVIQAYRH